jgi:hypothetical protein
MPVVVNMVTILDIKELCENKNDTVIVLTRPLKRLTKNIMRSWISGKNGMRSTQVRVAHLLASTQQGQWFYVELKITQILVHLINLFLITYKIRLLEEYPTQQ